MKTWILSLAFCFTSAVLAAQPFLWETLQMEEVQKQDVRDIAEAGNGDQWILLDKGALHRGISGSYTYHNLDSLFPNADFTKIKLLHGRPWLVTKNSGAYFLDSLEWVKVGKQTGLPSDEVYDVAAGDSGRVWIICDGAIARYNFSDLEILDSLNWWDRPITVRNYQNRIYILFSNKLIYWENSQWHSYMSIPAMPAGSFPGPLALLFEDHKPQVLASSSTNGLYLFDGHQWNLILEGHHIREFAVEEEKIYIHHDGFYEYVNGELKFLQQYPWVDHEPKLLKASLDGGLWLTVYDRGPVLVKMKVTDGKEYDELSVNNLLAGISSGGGLFENQGAAPRSKARYGNFSPRNQDSASFMKTAALWIKAGINGENYLSTNTIDGRASNFASGPLSSSYDLEYLKLYDRVWKVSRAEIQKHITEVFSPSYQMPEAILNWPAHGRIQEGEAKYLAPFTDVNGNNIYEPELGDHPNIKGDQAIYFIINDVRSLRHYFTPALGVELHGMAYAFNSESSDLANSMFFSYTIFNRSGSKMEDVKTSLLADLTLGSYETSNSPYRNDPVGCDSALGVVYSYNDDNEDEGVCGFGPKPPAAGFLPLSQKLTGAISYYYYSPMGGPRKPSIPAERIRFMDIVWADSSRVYIENPDGILSYSNGDGYVQSGADLYKPTNFQYNDQVNWYQSPGTDWGYTIGSFETRDLEDGESFCLDLAFVTARGSDHLASLGDLKARAQRLKNWYAQQENSCLEPVTRFQGSVEQSVSLYPNPAQNQLIILVPEDEKLVKSTIFSMSGQKLAEFQKEKILNISALPSGAYVLQCEMEGGVSGFRFVKQ